MRDDQRGIIMLLSSCLALTPREASADLAPLPTRLRRAIFAAHLDEARIADLKKRARRAAWLPSVRVHFGMGSGVLAGVRDTSTGEYVTATSTDSWRVDFDASWSLDRLVYHSAEAQLEQDAVRVGRERRQLVRELLELEHRRADPATDAEERREIDAALDAFEDRTP